MKKLLLIFILLILTGCNDENIQTKNEIDLNKIIKLISNNYIYAKYALAPVDINQGYVSFDDKTYYYLGDDLKSLEELKKLTKEIFVSERWEIYFDIILANKELLIIDNKLYGNEKNVSCDIGSDYDFTTFKILKQNKEYIVIAYDDFEYYIYIKNNNYFLIDNIFKCLSEKEEMKTIME